jgi:hypothetical protein
MPFARRVIALAVMLVAVPVLAFNAWAGGPGGGIATCQVMNSSGGAVAIRGTVAVEALGSGGEATAVDYTFRLTRSGATAFFRLTKNTLVFGKTNEDMLCLALDDPNLSAQILAAFNLPRGHRLVITDKSITNAEVQSLDQVIPGTERASTMADVVIYVQ